MADVFAYLEGFGGSGSGGVLVVTAPAGVTVTVSKDDKSYTKTAAGGTATFKGLKTGTWTVTITDGSQTATQSVYVGTDYAITMAFFMATISVTYPEGSICTCSDGATTLTAPDTSGSHTFTVNSAGDWTVTITDGEATKSDVVSITEDGQSESIDIGYQILLFVAGGTRVSWLTRTSGAGSVSITDDSIALNGLQNGGNNNWQMVYTEEMYDLTNYTILRARLGTSSNTSRSIGVTLTPTSFAFNPSYVALKSSSATEAGTEISVDITALTGEYYIAIHQHFPGTEDGTNRFTEIIVE